MDLNDPATPCGLVAKSYFNDKFTNFKKTGATNPEIDIKETDIAWATDKEYKFANVEITKDKLPADSKTRTIWKDDLKDDAGKAAPWKNV